MQNIRRLYLYAVSFVSLEVVLWGSIGLLRSLFTGQEIGGGNANRLAGALSLILVGIPVFLLHWRLIQRDLQNEPEARSVRLRAIFLYGLLLATLIPIAQNVLSLLDRLFLQLLGRNPTLAMLGGNQTWSDNLVAIIANAVAAFYFYRVLKTDWGTGLLGDAFAEVRRLYRYIWLVYGLVLVAAGLEQLIQFVLTVWGAIGAGPQALLANGLALLLVGIPIWIYTDHLIQRSLADPAERDSLLRLVVLYILVFVSVTGFLTAVGVVLYHALRVLLGAPFILVNFLGEIAIPVSLAVSMGMVWVYYGPGLRGELKGTTAPPTEPEALSQADLEKDQQLRARLRRLYFYVLAFLGLLAAFIGLQLVLTNLLELALGGITLGVSAQRSQLASAIAALLVGLPLWILTWRPMAIEASRVGEAGDDARRSMVRRGYLYLILFAGVLGVMFSAGALIYQILRALLGQQDNNLLLAILQPFITMLLFLAVLAYHWLILRGDGKLAEQSLARRYAQFPVLVLAPDEDDFSELLARTLQSQAPGLPVAIHPVNQGAPDASLSAARVVILPAELAIRPGEALRLWLQSFNGERLVLAVPTKGWYWIPGGRKSRQVLTRQAVQFVRQLAEGQEVLSSRDNATLTMLAYVLASLFILELIFLGVTLIGSLFFD
jgi:hypothetical protein